MEQAATIALAAAALAWTRNASAAAGGARTKASERGATARREPHVPKAAAERHKNIKLDTDTAAATASADNDIAAERAGLDAFPAIAAASARAMETTARVGDPKEDQSMAIMRPTLARINMLGFVTTNSQQGELSGRMMFKDGYDEGEVWQRAYVSGFMTRGMAWSLRMRLDLEDGLVVGVAEYSQSYQAIDALRAHTNHIPVTRETRTSGFFAYTHVPMVATVFEDDWMNLLPETRLAQDTKLMRRVAPAVVSVFIVDTHWGRPDFLFARLIDVLEGRGKPIPQLTSPAIEF